MRYLCTLLGLALIFTASAQQVVDVTKHDVALMDNLFFTVGGEPFVNAKFVRLVEGTPYFKDEWEKATVTMPGGKEYKNVSIKLDLFDNELHFLNDKNVELVASTPVKAVSFPGSTGSDYRFVHTSFIEQSGTPMKNVWLQQLTSGTASLYKQFSKKMTENTPYGSATTEQKINTVELYLVYYNNAFIEIKKLKDAPSVLANKQKELEEFLKTKDDKKLSTEQRFMALIDYYNTLLK